MSFNALKFPLVLLALFVGGSAPAALSPTLQKIKDSGVLKVGMYQGYVPFCMKKPDGTWIGFEVEMMKAFSESLGKTLGLPQPLKLEMTEQKWEGIIPSLHAKKFDVLVAGMDITPERAQAVLFSDPYVDAGTAVLIAKKHMGHVTRLEELDQPDKMIAVQLGTTGDFYAAKKFKQAKITKFDSENDAASAVLLGKMDAFLMDKPFVEVFSRRKKGQIGKLDVTYTDGSIGAAFRKKDVELHAAFNAFLRDWRKSGGHDRTTKDYFERLVWLQYFPNLR